MAKRMPTKQQAVHLFGILKSAIACEKDGKHFYECVLTNEFESTTRTVTVPAEAMATYSAFKKSVATITGVIFLDRVCEEHRNCWRNAVESALREGSQ